LIRDASSSWLLLHALNHQRVEEVSSTTFNLAEVAKRHPTSIARSILYIAVCVQQLDPDFDASRLHLLPSIDARLDKYMTTVQSLVTSDDEMVSTIEGLECLVLQGLYHINAGNPRRAWLTFRRALNLGQLMGIHRKKGSTIPGGREMWFQAVQVDRYLVSDLIFNWKVFKSLMLLFSVRDYSWDCQLAQPILNSDPKRRFRTRI